MYKGTYQNNVRVRVLSVVFLTFASMVVIFTMNVLEVQAQTIKVPSDYPTIQGAIGSAVDGDTVLVAPGTYIENINFLGKAITVTSEQGPEVTIIDGNQNDSVVTFNSGEDLTSVLSGFTVQNGDAYFGAGITLGWSSPTIIDNIFDSNGQGAGGFGAAIGGNGSSPKIEGNIFRNNTCDNQSSSGVVSFVNRSSPRIINNIFENNPCRAINMTLPVGTIPEVINNTIVNNRVGVSVDRRISAALQIYRNNILVGNEIGLEVDFGSEINNPTWENNLVFDNDIDYDVISDQTGINGNISADPLFVDLANSDFHLTSGSQGIDAGTNTGAPTTDFDGNPRPIDGDDDGVAIVDMGAYEFPLPLINVNDLVTFIPIRSTYNATADTTGCPEGFVGKFSFDARLENSSSDTLSNLMCECTTLTNGNLFNADGGSGGEGASLTIPMTGGYSDGKLSPGEYVDVHFEICLTQWRRFSFFVDVLGMPSS